MKNFKEFLILIIIGISIFAVKFILIDKGTDLSNNKVNNDNSEHENFHEKSDEMPEEIKEMPIEEEIDEPVELEGDTLDAYKKYFKECNKEFISHRKEIIENRKAEKKIVYITIDDGPSENNELMLDILKKYDVKATFFITGIERPQMITKIKNDGHAIALHTNTHNYKVIYQSELDYLRDLYEIQNAVYIATGKYSHILRFPGGSNNITSESVCSGIMNKLKPLVEELGFEYYDWNIGTGDSSKNTTAEMIINNVNQGLARGHDENIILMHDMHDNTREALPSIIENLQDLGYKLKTITDDTIPIHLSIY